MGSPSLAGIECFRAPVDVLALALHGLEPNLSMQGHVALVTGGASGIGRASALQLAKKGFHVVIADVDVLGAVQTCEEIQKECEVEAVFYPTDVSQEDDVRVLVASIREKFGRLDVCLNNAGIEGDRALLHDYNTDTFDKVMAVNLRGVFLCMKYEIPLMLDTGSAGSIVITSSSAGLQGFPEFSAYSASKHALVGLARSAAKEYAGRIRINTINPATTDTPMVDRFGKKWPELQATINSSYPMGRIATADEVAEAAVWLATRATYVTGQTLVIDGGDMCS